jgi:siroheme synthase
MDWSMLARPGQTAVFYMGLAGLPRILQQLQAHGMPPERAAAVIEQGTRPGQRVILGTVATLAQQVEQAQVKSPALLIVGEVTRLHEQLRWFNTTAQQAEVDVSEMKSGKL